MKRLFTKSYVAVLITVVLLASASSGAVFAHETLWSGKAPSTVGSPAATITWNLPWGLDADPASVNIWTYPMDAVTVTLANVEGSMPAGLLIWHYGGPTEGWQFYKKGWGAVNTLETLIPGKGYIGIVPTASVWEIPGEIVYYEETKIITEEEAENIVEVTDNGTRILFSESTAFVAGIERGDVFVSEHPVPGAEYGFLVRVIEVSDDGKVVEVEPATLEDVIEEGVISVTGTIPVEDLMNDAMWAMGVEVLQAQGGYYFNKTPAQGVTIEGYIDFTDDADFYIDASILRGLVEFRFVFSPNLEMEATLRVEQGVSWSKSYTMVTIPGPPIPIWGPVTITPEIGLVVGTTGTVDASLEATVTYERGYDVGLSYVRSRTPRWETINEIRGEGATLGEPSFSGQANALVFGGVVLSGTAGVAYAAEATLGAKLLGNIRASGGIENSPWRWQYDLELYLSAQVLADLNLLRIAHVSWESDPWEYPDPPYTLAYGASGRVTTEGGEGLEGVEISFSNGHSSATTDEDGYWRRHLLRGDVQATPEKTGYTFDPPSITITGSASDVDFQAFGGEPRQYDLIISSTAGGSVTTPGEGISTHDAGTLVDLVAEHDEGYHFVNWTGNVGTIANVNDPSTTITMNGDYSITANFEENTSVQYDLTISSTAGGSVTTPGEGISTHYAGTVVDLVAEHNEGYHFVNWTGDVGTVADVNLEETTITMNDSYSITANFEEEGEEEPVYFPDPNLEAAIREAIGKPTGDIYCSDLEGLTYFSACDDNIANLTGLEYCTNLEDLCLWSNHIIDISPLANLTKLTSLAIERNLISDISPLSNLTSLTLLVLSYNQISDVSPLADLPNLAQLWLWDNQISDISALAGLTNLTYVGLWNNQISDISPLAGLTNLTHLDIQGNQLSDITPLAGLTNLDGLNLRDNQITDISPLAGLANLRYLTIDTNQISDISPLAGLTKLRFLWLDTNQISNISPLAGITNLRELSLAHNQISNISPLAGLTNLTGGLWLSDNQISDIEPLVNNLGLSGMVDLRYNPLSSDSINVYIPQLQARGVTVYY